MYRQKLANTIIGIISIIMATVSTNVYALNNKVNYVSENNICEFKTINHEEKLRKSYKNDIIIEQEDKEQEEEEISLIIEEEPIVQYINNDILYNKAAHYLTYTNGVVYYNNHKETYYAEEVLPGKGLNIPGRHVAYDGTIRDIDSYIVVAADLSFLPRGSIVETSLGLAKVYDTGCAYGTIDIYVNAFTFKNANINTI